MEIIFRDRDLLYEPPSYLWIMSGWSSSLLGNNNFPVKTYIINRRLEIKNNLFKSCPLRITFITLLLHCNFYWIVDLKLSFSIIHVMDKTHKWKIFVWSLNVKTNIILFLFSVYYICIYNLSYVLYFMKVYFHLATLMTSNYSMNF